MKIGYILAAAAAVVGIWLWRKYEAATRLSFSLGVPKNVRLTSSFLEWVQPIAITNPEAIGIKVQSISLDNYFGTAQIGRSVLFTPTTIAAQSTTELPVIVQVSFSSLIANIPDFWQTIKTANLSFQLIGDLTAEGVKIPINQKITIPIKL
jgi:LEA14-like dessication related protein